MENTEAAVQAILDAKEMLAAAGIPGRLPAGFTVTWHAGALGTQENSLDSIRTAVAHDAQIVEFDVSFRPDGTPVIIHSSKPGETEGTLLADALAIVAAHPTCRINLDLKSICNLPAVDALAEEAGLTDRVFFTGVGLPWVKAVRSQSRIPYYLNHPNVRSAFGTAYLIRLLKRSGAVGLNANYGNLTGSMVARLHRHGLLVSEWTVNEIADQVRVLSALPDNITTRRPDLLKALLAPGDGTGT